MYRNIEHSDSETLIVYKILDDKKQGKKRRRVLAPTDVGYLFPSFFLFLMSNSFVASILKEDEGLSPLSDSIEMLISCTCLPIFIYEDNLYFMISKDTLQFSFKTRQ